MILAIATDPAYTIVGVVMAFIAAFFLYCAHVMHIYMHREDNNRPFLILFYFLIQYLVSLQVKKESIDAFVARVAADNGGVLPMNLRNMCF